MTCPNCERVNPRGTKRCLCGYVFEFDTPNVPEASAGPRGGVSGTVALAGVGTAALTAILSHGRIPPAESAAVVGLFLGLVGIFCIAGAACDWEFFMNDRRARLFVIVLGRTGARWFYSLLGGALAGAGVSFF